MLVLIISVISLLILVDQNGGQLLDSDLKCVEIEECKPLVDLLKRQPISANAQKYLKEANCGWTAHNPKVWCRRDYDACLTPDGLQGVCAYYQQCPYFLDKLVALNVNDDQNRRYLRLFKCEDILEDKLRVCCPGPRSLPETNLLAIINQPVTHKPQLYYPTEKSSTPAWDLTSNLILFTSPDLGTSSVRPYVRSEPLSLTEDPFECGKQRQNFRIIGGTATDIDEFPWVAILQYRTSKGLVHKCQGVLVNERYVVTATHCVDDDDLLDSVVLGDYDTRNATDCVYYDAVPDCALPPQVIKVEKIIPYPNQVAPFYHDIALIRLQWEATLTDFVKPICLPAETFDTSKYNNYTVVGWGQTETGRERSFIKRKVDLLVVEKQYCTDVYKNVLSDQQLCLGSYTRDTCLGDSGSPVMKLVADDNGIAWYLVGLVSVGYNNPCGLFPGVYTYVPSYVKWIQDNIRM